jgi:hypothetical protein
VAHQQFIDEMTRIPALAAEFGSGKRKYPSVIPDKLTPADLKVFRSSIEQLADPPSIEVHQLD